MKLLDLIKEIGQVFMIDETIKVYCYKNKIELIDYTPEYNLENGKKIDATYGHFLTLNLTGNRIIWIDNSSLSCITLANKNMLIYLANLIGTEIEDYDQYKKLPMIQDLDCINIEMC